MSSEDNIKNNSTKNELNSDNNLKQNKDNEDLEPSVLIRELSFD